ncbi:hypothetical protein VP01_227g4 [Puccinia sorghi]|uniref:DDE Tnp4 domain-containing protein n=1 Tax=Puccinia sorghi TaxID=27349 RepID=A0A0L6V8V4_9BASI|nr:hypothetical protein VP01_227g4 [Puccinia sorghi]
MVCMNKDKFVCLADRIRGDPIFFPKGNKSQAPVEWQLLVMLANLGVLGTVGGLAFLLDVFCISGRSCFLPLSTIGECIQLHLPLPPGFNISQKGQARNSQSNLFKNCVRFADGTIIPLALGPRKNKEYYWMHKISYGLNSMILTYITFQLIDLHQEFFEPEKYLLADSGYTFHLVIVPAFKKPCEGYLDWPHKKFNYLLSTQQVVAENTIGVLKRRWKTLTNLPLVINDNKSAACALIWIQVCCILHNYLLENQSEAFSFLGRQSVESEEPCGTKAEVRFDGRQGWRDWLFK